MPDVFLSYNREDRARAHIVAEGLQAEGLDVWWDTALRAGENYDEVTESNLRSASAVVVLWSKRSVQSKWVRAEATLGQRKALLVPAMIEECDRPLLFELIQTADLVRWNGDRTDEEWRGFIEVIKSRVKASAKLAAAPAEPPRAAASAETTAKTKNLEAATALHTATMETTFWQSIKDGRDVTEFEAYLTSYPDGHFAALARNRIAALKAPKPAAPKPVAAKPATPPPPPVPKAPQAKAPPTEDRRPAEPVRSPPPPRNPPPPRAQQSKPKSGGANMGVIAAVVVALLAVGGGVAYWLSLPKGENVAAKSTPATTPAEASAPPKETPAEPAKAAPPPEEITAPKDGDPAATQTAANSSEALVVADNGTTTAPTPTPAKVASAAGALSLIGSSASAKIGGAIKDCATCPDLAAIPAGRFQMGSPKEEPGRYGYEGPRHEVTIAAFALGKHEVTFEEWDACVADGGCGGYQPSDRGYGRATRPVIGVSFNDAQAYIEWLSKKTGRAYRLPSEAEWEYAARGNTDTAYWWGPYFEASRVPKGAPAPVGSFAANAFGLYDMAGNAGEWVADCYNSTYTDAPTDGSAVTTGDCGKRVIRGGSFKSAAGDLRAANRGRIERGTRVGYLGFRVAAPSP